MSVRCSCECLIYDTPKVPPINPEGDHVKDKAATKVLDFNILGPEFRLGDVPNTPVLPLANPDCYGMSEIPEASQLRERVSRILQNRTAETGSTSDDEFEGSPLFTHLAHGLALTVGSALGSSPPSKAECLAAYQVPNGVGLTAGARAWSKHAHRSASPDNDKTANAGWWGRAKGPMPVINEGALAIFELIMGRAAWRNLHWLPHKVLVYEVRVYEGYGMRWSQDQSDPKGDGSEAERLWMFRGFLEPTMENGHDLKWRHTINVKS